MEKYLLLIFKVFRWIYANILHLVVNILSIIRWWMLVQLVDEGLILHKIKLFVNKKDNDYMIDN
jgi:hypothetical protein